MRKVENTRFKAEPDVESGLRKAFEYPEFAGIFKDSTGKVHDVRPMESCPSLSNFEKMEKLDLQKLLMKAYESQLEELRELN